MRDMQSGVRESEDAFTTDRMQKQARSHSSVHDRAAGGREAKVPQAEGQKKNSQRQRICVTGMTVLLSS